MYRGKIPHGFDDMEGTEVIVKIFVDGDRNHKFYKSPLNSDVLTERSELEVRRVKSRFENEVKFLLQPSVNNHPNLAKLIGYCEMDKLLGAVYELSPLDTLHNLIVKDSFKWLPRIKAALGFARLLHFLHSRESPYIVGNIDAEHILIDQDFNPILLELGMLSGGVLGDFSTTALFISSALQLRTQPRGSFGYTDLVHGTTGHWSPKCDIYSYGVVLISLISKRAVNLENRSRSPERNLVDVWAQKVYDPDPCVECCLVDSSLKEEPGYDACDGLEITKLGMRCMSMSLEERPTAEQIARSLQRVYAALSPGA